MFLQSLHGIAAYNLWANEQLAQPLQTISEAQFHADIQSSFRSIVKTIAHVHGAEGVWHQRLEKVQPTVFYKAPDNANGLAELDKWLNVSRGLTDLILSYNEPQLLEAIAYTDVRGNAHTNVRWQMIQHCVNHSSYHRGQLVTMLRQVGLTTIPSTDLIAFYRMQRQPA